MEGSPAYLEAERLGKSLAELGHTVLTGGYAGTMEAVSRGASEAGGHVIGVTCAEIQRSHAVVANRWVREEWKRGSLIERLQSLIDNCDAALVLPGGPGTLTELALTWNLMIVGSMPRKPLIVIGPAWKAVLDEFDLRLGEYTSTAQRELVLSAADGRAALELLRGIS
jgi:uncharacterized protein (TIGR00725 family)